MKGDIVYYKNYCIDKLGCKDIDLNKDISSIEHWKVPEYDTVKLSYPIGEGNESEEEKDEDINIIEVKQNTCFNCGNPGHSVNNCTMVTNQLFFIFFLLYFIIYFI